MFNPILSMTPSRRRTLLLLGSAHVALLVFFLSRTWKLQNENALLAAGLRATALPSISSGRVTLLQRENERLKSDLATIPGLAAAAKRLETEITEQQMKNSANWAGRSNLIQEAIEQKLKELREIWDWDKDQRKLALVEAAKARLAEKASLESNRPEDVEKEYSQLKSVLTQLGLSMKNQLEFRREWMKSDKSPDSRTAFQSNFGQARKSWETAMHQLGDDQVLYEELPVKATDEDLSRTPVLRSIIPDLHGMSATVYLNGSVVLSPANSR